MPIIIKDYEWSESETKLDLSIPQKGIKSSSIDILVTNLYVKVNYSPYFFELHLKNEIDDNKARVVIKDNTITIYLVKQEHSLWGTVVNTAAKDASKRRELVAAAHKYHEEKVKKDVEKRATVKAEQNKWALRTAMDLDSSEKDRIEAVKQAERDRVTQEMDEWQSLDDDQKEKQYLKAVKESKQPEGAVLEEVSDTQQNTVIPDSESSSLGTNTTATAATPSETNPDPKPSHADERARKFEKIKHNLANPLKAQGKECSKKDKSEEESKDEKPVWEKSGPRQPREITVSFSPRYFPSAARESTAAEEEAWMEKNIRAQTIVKPKDADTKDEERNPIWLSDKAGVFYKMGNFPAAINAYSEAIKISPSLPKLYINRASCYIVLNLFDDAVTDCTRALDLLTPPVEANRLSRVRTLAKRGSALCQLGQIDRALEDYELASKLSPDDEALKGDLAVLHAHKSGGASNSQQHGIVAT